jgi:hypothetical protein
LAEVPLPAGDLSEALQLARQGEQALKAALSNDHWLTALAWQTHGAVRHAQGDYRATEDLLTRSFLRPGRASPARQKFADQGLQRLIALYLHRLGQACRDAEAPGAGGGQALRPAGRAASG